MLAVLTSGSRVDVCVGGHRRNGDDRVLGVTAHFLVGGRIVAGYHLSSGDRHSRRSQRHADVDPVTIVFGLHVEDLRYGHVCSGRCRYS